MAISYVGAGAVGTGTNPTLALPSGYTEGDLLLIVVANQTSAGSAPTGWATMVNTLVANNFLTIYYRVAGASEVSVSLSTGGTGGKAVMLAYRGANAYGGLSAYTAVTGTSLATATVASTVAANDFVLSIFADNNVASAWTAPGSTTTRVSSDSTATFCGLLIVDETQASVGVTTSRTASGSVSNTISSIQLVLTTSSIANNITFVSSGSVVTGNTTPVPLPTSYAVGDLLLLLAASITTVTTPTGWTLVGTTTSYGVFYKIATSSETSVTIPGGIGNAGKAVMLAYRNALSASVATASSSGTSTVPATSTTTAYTSFVGSTGVIFFADNASATPSTWSTSGVPTIRINSANTSSSNGMLICDINKGLRNSSLYQLASITNSTSWAAVPIELKQANTFYIDPQNGNDASSGAFYPAAFKNINGATATKGVGLGDTVRIKEAPLYNTGVNATWTSVTSKGVTPFSARTITAATNATPIVCTLTNHGYSTGDVIQITGAAGNTATNGNWKVTVVNANSFSLDDSSGNGAWTSGGAVNPIFCRTITTATPLVKPIASFANLKTVSLGVRSAWVGANANITTALNTTFTKGGTTDTITIAVGATTGKMAYYTLPATLDLSSYQQLSLFINQVSGITLGGLTISLCSDTTGDTPVNTFTIPSTGNLPPWTPFTIDNGSALGSSIKSIAVYRPTVTGVAQVFNLNSIVACKAPSSVDAISNTSLITKNNGTEGAYSVGGFGGSDGSIIFLDAAPDTINSVINAGAYYGTSETVALYRIEPFNPYTLNSLGLAPSTTDANTKCTFAVSGTNGNQITFSGGWNGTDMSTRTGQTWFSNQNGSGFGISSGSFNYITTDKVNYTRCYYGWYTNNSIIGHTIQNCNYTATSSSGISIGGISVPAYVQFQNCIISNTNSYGINFAIFVSDTITNPMVVNNCTISGSATANLNVVTTAGKPYINITNCSFNTSSVTAVAFPNLPLFGSMTSNSFNYFNTNGITSANTFVGTIDTLTFVPEPNGGTAIISAPLSQGYSTLPQNIYTTFKNVTVNAPTTQPPTGAIGITNCLVGCQNFKFVNSTFSATNVTYTNGNTVYEQGGTYFYNCTGVPTTNTFSTYTYPPYLLNTAIYSQDEGNTVGNNKIYFSGGLATSQTAVRHTPSGYAWSMAPTSTTNTTSTYPMKLKIGSIAANGGSAVTITAWMQRTDTGLTMQLVCPGGQPYGPTSDTTASMTAAANTWEQLSISFTPTQNAVFDIYAYAYGGTTYTGYVDDLGVSQ